MSRQKLLGIAIGAIGVGLGAALALIWEQEVAAIALVFITQLVAWTIIERAERQCIMVAGWGKDVKRLCEAGTQSCSRCNNTNVFDLYQVKKKVSLFFVPVATWGAEYFLVCPICHEAVEVTAERKDAILGDSVGGSSS